MTITHGINIKEKKENNILVSRLRRESSHKEIGMALKKANMLMLNIKPHVRDFLIFWKKVNFLFDNFISRKPIREETKTVPITNMINSALVNGVKVSTSLRQLYNQINSLTTLLPFYFLLPLPCKPMQTSIVMTPKGYTS